MHAQAVLGREVADRGARQPADRQRAVGAGAEPPAGAFEQRAELASQLAELDPHEVPLNFLNPRPGTPFGELEPLDGRDALRAVAAFRLAMPRTVLRFAGGREITLGDLARDGMLGGINAVIVGNYLTTLGRPATDDLEMLQDLRMPLKGLSQTL